MVNACAVDIKRRKAAEKKAAALALPDGAKKRRLLAEVARLKEDANSLASNTAPKRNVFLRYLPAKVAAKTGAAKARSMMWLTAAGAKELAEFQERVFFLKVSDNLRALLENARWRARGKIITAETEYFVLRFARGRRGWIFRRAEVLKAVSPGIQKYIDDVIGDAKHLANRGILPDYRLRKLSGKEASFLGLSRNGAVIAALPKVIIYRLRYWKRRGEENPAEKIEDLFREMMKPIARPIDESDRFVIRFGGKTFEANINKNKNALVFTSPAEKYAE